MKITLLANAGLYIEIDDERFLIDALHYNNDHEFSKLPKNINPTTKICKTRTNLAPKR